MLLHDASAALLKDVKRESFEFSNIRPSFDAPPAGQKFLRTRDRALWAYLSPLGQNVRVEVYPVYLCLQKSWSLNNATSAGERTSGAIQSGRYCKNSKNYCSRHLVKPDAEVKFTDQMGRIMEE